jgi:hypothetical protein
VILRHYGSAPLVFDPSRTYESHRDPYFKPCGLWLSVEGNDDGWKDWCVSEDWNTESLTHSTDFALVPGANVLFLTTAEEVLAFTKRWQQAGLAADPWRSRMIDWPAVMKLYDGIVIAPYQWELRMERETFWYYSWDCASACIWNLSAVEPVGTPSRRIELEA